MKTARMTIRLLREFSIASPEWGVSDLARRLDLDKATIYRLLKSLCEEGIIEQDPLSKRYRLGIAILDLAAARLQAFGFVQHAIDELRVLREAVGESVALHVRDGRDMICVQYSDASHPLTVRWALAERIPVHLTASGILCLADLADDEWRALAKASAQAHPELSPISDEDLAANIAKTRRDGVSITDQIYQKGVRGMACAVRDGQGVLVATVTVVAPVPRISMEELEGLRPRLDAAAANIGAVIPGGIRVLAPRTTDIFKS